MSVETIKKELVTKEVKFTDKELEDLLNALNLVIKNLDATHIEELERYMSLFKKISA